MESFSENDISSTSIENETLNTSSDQLVQLSQWMSQIVNRVEISRYSVETLNHLNSILGKLKNDKTYTKLDNQVVEALAGILAEQDTSNQTTDLKEVIFKLEKKVFIESIDFYQKTTSEPSSIMKIQMEVEDKGHTIWLTVFEASIPIPVQSDNQLFSPKLKASSGMSDTIKIFIRGDLTHLEGIEVKGSLFANDLLPKIAKPKDPLESYSMLPKQLYQLVGSDLFSDVVFEVEGKKVLAHKNILVARSEYFRAMLIEERGFVEAKQAKKNPLYPLYIGDIRHEIFMQVMNFVYTGHIDEKSFTHSIAGKLVKMRFYNSNNIILNI